MHLNPRNPDIRVSKHMRSLKTLVSVFALMLAATFAASAQTALPALSGGQVDLEAQRGKVVILALGASWLPLSNKQAEYTNMLAKRYTGKDVVVYFVATDSATAKSKNFATNADIESLMIQKKFREAFLRVTFQRPVIQQQQSKGQCHHDPFAHQSSGKTGE